MGDVGALKEELDLAVAGLGMEFDEPATISVEMQSRVAESVSELLRGLHDNVLSDGFVPCPRGEGKLAKETLPGSQRERMPRRWTPGITAGAALCSTP